MGILFKVAAIKKQKPRIDFAEFYNSYYLPYIKELNASGEVSSKPTSSIFASAAVNIQECFDSFCNDRGYVFGEFEDLQEQLMADYANHSLVYRTDGSVDLAATWSGLDAERKGAVLMSAMYVSVFTKQKKTKVKIGPLVPLYFAAHKLYNNVPYSKFLVMENYNYFVNFLSPALLALVQFSLTEKGQEFFSDYPEDYSSVIAPLRKSLFVWGGQQKDYRTFDKASKLRENGLDPKTPGYAVHVALQSWAAYPGNWKDTFNEKYALLNPLDWDTPPEPIWGEEEETKVETYRFGRSAKFKGKNKW